MEWKSCKMLLQTIIINLANPSYFRFNLVQRFLSKRWKCEMLTDEGRKVMTITHLDLQAWWARWACFSYTLLTYPYYVFVKFLEINFLKFHISINKMQYTFFNNYTFNQWGSQQGLFIVESVNISILTFPIIVFGPFRWVSEWVSKWLLFNAKWAVFQLQSNLSYVTFQGNIEIESHKTGGHLIQF
jgi:hypothetical protein